MAFDDVKHCRKKTLQNTARKTVQNARAHNVLFCSQNVPFFSQNVPLVPKMFPIIFSNSSHCFLKFFHCFLKFFHFFLKFFNFFLKMFQLFLKTFSFQINTKKNSKYPGLIQKGGDCCERQKIEFFFCQILNKINPDLSRLHS